jgi:hypothetical protein
MDDLLYVLEAGSNDPKKVSAVQVPIDQYRKMERVVGAARELTQRFNVDKTGLGYLTSSVLTLDMPRYLLIHHADGWPDGYETVPGYESGSIVEVEQWKDEDTPFIKTRPEFGIHTAYEPTSWDFRIEDRVDG